MTDEQLAAIRKRAAWVITLMKRPPFGFHVRAQVTELCGDVTALLAEVERLRADAALGAAVRAMPVEHFLMRVDVVTWEYGDKYGRHEQQAPTPDAALGLQEVEVRDTTAEGSSGVEGTRPAQHDQP